MSDITIIIIFAAAGLAVLFGVISLILLYIRKRKRTFGVSGSGQLNTAPEVSLSSEYVAALEKTIRREFKKVIDQAASNMEDSLREVIQEITKEGEDLSKTLKDFEERFSEDFEIATTRLEKRLSQEAKQTIQEVKSNDERLVSAVQKLSEEAENNFRNLLARAWEGLDKELEETRGELKKEAKELVVNTFNKEAEEMRKAIADARNNTINSLTKIYEDTEKKKRELEKQAEKEVEEYKKKRIQQFEERMDEVVSQFLIENAGKAFDLDKQRDYILKMLEQHREELKNDIYE